MTDARHSSASNEHYTPPAIVEAARATMGGIDLDPASCELANKVVRAGHYLVRDGLFTDWDMAKDYAQRVLLNPPGGVLDADTLEPNRRGAGRARSGAAVWWHKLVHEYLTGNVSQAVFVCFNLEVLRTTQAPACPDRWAHHMPALAFPICYLKDRPRFWNEATPEALRGTHGQPTHAGAVVYLPPAHEQPWKAGVQRFADNFSPLGYVRI